MLVLRGNGGSKYPMNGLRIDHWGGAGDYISIPSHQSLASVSCILKWL